MDIKKMEYFLALVEKKNLSDAADACFITESALSQSLSKLENMLGTKLVVRRKNKWSPTSSGRLFLQFASEVVALNTKFMQDLHQNKSESVQSIVLGMSHERATILFPRVYTRFLKEYPDIPVRLCENTFFVLQQLTIEGEVDILLGTAPLKHQTDVKRQLVSKSFFMEELVLIVPQNHRFAARVAQEPGARLQVAELTGESFICHTPKKVVRHAIDKMCCKNSISPQNNYSRSAVPSRL